MIAPHPTPAEIRYPPAMRDVSESPRFQVSVNGVVQTTCGTGRRDTLMILLTWGAHDPDALENALYDEADLGPWLQLEVGSQDTTTELSRTWLRMEAFAPGDVVTVRVLEPGPVDAPQATWLLREGPFDVPFRHVARGDASSAGREDLREARFGIRWSGELRRTIGVGRVGSFGALVDWSAQAGDAKPDATGDLPHVDPSPPVEIMLWGRSPRYPELRRWPLPARLACGDEVSFEILGPGPSDASVPMRDIP